MSSHVLPLLALVLGHLCHILALVVEARSGGDKLTILGHIGNRPYQTALAVCGSLAGYLLLLDTGQLTIVAAFGVGYLANDSLEAIGTATKRKLGA